jgi:hypothetical protein
MWRAGAASLLAVMLMSGPAAAEIVVLESTVSAIKKGAKLADSAMISVPQGRRIRLLLPNGTTRRVVGPYDGPALVSTGTPGVLPSVRRASEWASDGGASTKGIGATPKILPPPGSSPPRLTVPVNPGIVVRQPAIPPGSIRK